MKRLIIVVIVILAFAEIGYVHSVKSYGKSRRIVTTRNIIPVTPLAYLCGCLRAHWRDGDYFIRILDIKRLLK
jgi:hypothetical protein